MGKKSQSNNSPFYHQQQQTRLKTLANVLCCPLITVELIIQDIQIKKLVRKRVNKFTD